MMPSPDQCYDGFCSPVGSPPEDTYEKFLEKKEGNSSSSPSSSESNAIGFDDFIETVDIPPTSPDEDTPCDSAAREDVRTFDKLAGPPQPTGMPLLGCPFVLKLYLAAGSDAMTMINWSPNGRQLVVEYEALQDHLTGGGGIFRYRSVKQFTKKLRNEGFRRIQPEEMEPFGRLAAKGKPTLVYYQQPQFVRGELCSLRKLMEDSLLIEKYYPMGAQFGEAVENKEEEPKFPVPLYMPSKSHLERMKQRGDKCCSIISVRSPIQEARCRFHTLLIHLKANELLQASTDSPNEALIKKGSRPGNFPKLTSSSIKFVRPHDSVIILDADKPLPEYAGYYGEVSPNKVNKFFGDYMPRYGNKTTGLKEIVVETTQPPPSNFQQNLPIGLASSEGEDDEPEDVPLPVSPAGQDSDMDCMPSTSAAAALRSSGRKISADSVDDQDLEEAMQELCGGSTSLKENVSSGSRGRAKAQSHPKATSRKRRAKSFDSSSSENEAEESRKPKRAKKVTFKESIQVDAIEDDQEVQPKRRGPKSKAKTPKATSRKRFASPNTDEASPPRKRDKKDSRKAKQLKELEEQFLVSNIQRQKQKDLRKTDEENVFEELEENEYEYQEEDAEENEYDFQDEVENDEEYEEYYIEEIVEENEQEEGYEQSEYQSSEENENPQGEHHEEEYIQEEKPEGEYPEGEYPEGEYAEGEYPGGEYPEGENPEGEYPEGEYAEGEYTEGEYPEGEYPEGEYTEVEYPEGEYPVGEYQEDEYLEEVFQPEEEYHPDQPEEEQLEAEYQEDEQPVEDINEAEVDEDNEEDLVAEEEEEEEESDDEEDEDDEEDAEDFEEDDDDDDDDYVVQYQAAPKDQEKPRRYDLRNSMRKSN